MADNLDPNQLECVEDLKNRSEEFDVFDLGVTHLVASDETNDDTEKILVGVDTLQDECVNIVDEWASDWDSSVEVVDSEYMDDKPHFLVYEFKPV